MLEFYAAPPQEFWFGLEVCLQLCNYWIEIIFPQSLIHYQHTYFTFA